jgi:cell wall-associated NlpC family hydrolase
MTAMPPLDPRLYAVRPDLADQRLAARVTATRYAAGEPAEVAVPIVPLRPRPDAAAGMDTELLLGERVAVYERTGGWAWVQADRDAYVGYVPESALSADALEPTHRVATLRTFLYAGASIKTPNPVLLPMGARLAIARIEGDFAITAAGAHVIAGHLNPVQAVAPDPVAVAELYLHTPYLWGGRTSLGLDCSGLVQTALKAAGHACPRDTDMQERWLAETATPIPAAAPDFTGLRRGDCVFWKGHVGIMTDAVTLLHANGHHMLTVKEPLAEAAARILAKSYGPVTGIYRLASSAVA